MLTKDYFNIIKEYFEDDYKYCKADNFSKETLIKIRFKYYNETVAKSIIMSLYEDLSKLDWRSQEEKIKRSACIKAHYVGSEYGYKEPSAGAISNFIRKTALYADTIILDEQILSQLTTSFSTSGQVALYSAIDYAFEFMSLEENGIFESNPDYPICQLAPPIQWLLSERNLEKTAWDLICESTKDYANQLYDTHFKTIEELRNYLSQIDNSQYLNCKNNQRLMTLDGITIDDDWLEKERSIYPSITSEDFYEGGLHAQKAVKVYDLIYEGVLGLTPITDSKLAWNAINWLIKNDNKNLFIKQKRLSNRHSLVMNSFGITKNDNYRWLGSIPISRLSQMRENGEIAEVRRLLSDGINNIEEADDDDYYDVAQQVYYNLDIALRKHQTEINAIKEKYQGISGVDSLVILSGSISFASALYQSFASAAGTLAGLSSIASGVTSIAVVARDYINHRNELKALKKKPISILFDAQEQYQREINKN
jgi:hypothetical protein